MTKNDKQYDLHTLGVLYEAMQDDIRKILEVVLIMLPSVEQIPSIAERVTVLEEDMSAVKVAVTDTNRELKDTNKRLDMADQKLEITKEELRGEIQATNREVKLLRKDVMRKFHEHERRITRLEHAQ